MRGLCAGVLGLLFAGIVGGCAGAPAPTPTQAPPDAQAPPVVQTPPDAQTPPVVQTPPVAQTPPVVQTPPVNQAPPAAAGARRTEAGALAGTAYYLDQFDDRVEVVAVGADGKARQVAVVPVGIPRAQVWSHLWSGGMALMVTPPGLGPGGHIYEIGLERGGVTDLGATMGPPFRLDIAPSKDGRYLAMKLSGYLDGLTVIDLQTGARVTPGPDHYLPGLTWSPATLTLAARAAGPDSGLPVQVGSQYWDGGDRLNLVGPDGAVTPLLPPQPLKLVNGPAWAPDGQWLAVTAGVALPIGEGPGGGSLFEPREVWLVNVAANRWVRWREAPADERLEAWPPEATAFVAGLGE